MKIFSVLWICFFAFLSSLNSLEINISYGKEKNAKYSIITLKNDEKFPCISIEEYGKQKTQIQCTIKKIPESGFLPINTEFFNVSYEMKNKAFVLTIIPTQKVKLFYIPDFLQEKQIFVQDIQSVSKIWQIVGYGQTLPFISTKSYQGINFPIKINPDHFDTIGQIDLSKNPLKSTISPDYIEYQKVKDLIEHQNYKTALNSIAATFKKFPQTIFAKDLLFYQIKALYSLGYYDNIIENANAWVKNYSSDDNTPEVLYLLGNTYAKTHFPTQANYYYKRIIEEYPHNRYTPLAKMQIAKALTENGTFGMARIYFSQAYEEARDLDSVSDIAIEWVYFELKMHNPDNAKELVQKILEKNPKFFLIHPIKTKQAMAYLAENHLYESAAKIGEYYFNHTDDNDSLHEPIGFSLGDLYAHAGNFDAAHLANQAYIKEYNHLPRTQKIQERDDQLLFKISGSDEEKIKRYDYIFKKYPHTEQSKKAINLKAKILLKQERYQEVLDMQKLIGINSPLYNQALLGSINQSISNNQCEKINPYLIELQSFEKIKEPQKAFKCLYDTQLYEKAYQLSQAYLKDKNSSDYLPWLYHNAQALHALARYKDSILASRDVLQLAKTNKQPQYNDILFTLFDDLYHTQSKNEMQEIYAQLAKDFRDDKRMINVYHSLLDDEKLDDSTIIIYANQLLDLQKKYQINDYTPSTEFKLIQAYDKLNEKEKALNVAESLTQQLSPNADLQRALYLKSGLEIALKKDPMPSIKACLSIKEESSWKILCQQAQELITSKNTENKEAK